MLLHHLTNKDRLPGIAERGLVPHTDDFYAPYLAVVWLTEATTTQWTAADRERSRLVGIDTDSWLPDCPLMLTVRIGSHDRKLVSFPRWLRRQNYNGHPPELYAYEAMQQWWVYFGTVPPEWIVEGLR